MSDLEARIAEVLNEHTLHMLTMATDDANGEWVVECNCDIPPISADGFFDGEKKFAAHQAAMLAPALAEAKVTALREAAEEVGTWGPACIPAARALVNHANTLDNQ